MLLLLLCGAAEALERVQIDWGSVVSDSWRLDNVSLWLDWDASGQSRLTVTVARIALADYRFEKVRLVCGAFELLPDQVDCRDGRLSLHSEQLDAAAVPATLNYRLDSGELNIHIRELPVAGGKLALALTRQFDGAWRVDAELDACALADVAQLLGHAGATTPELNYQGTVSGTLAVRAAAQGVQDIQWQLETRQAGYSNAAGSQAAEALVLASDGSASPDAGDWRVQASLTARQGMLYTDPLYLEFSEASPLALEAHGVWRSPGGVLDLQSLQFHQPGVAEGHLKGVVAPAAERAAAAPRTDAGTGQATRVSMKPGCNPGWRARCSANLKLRPELHGRLTLADAQPQALELQMQRVSFRDKSGLFGVQDLDVDLQWDNSDARRLSQLAWQGASFHRLQLGAAALQLETGCARAETARAAHGALAGRHAAGGPVRTRARRQ